MKNVAHHQACDKQQQRHEQALAWRHHHGHRKGRASQEDRGQLAPRARRVQGQREEQSREREVEALDLRGDQRARGHAHEARDQPRQVKENLHRQQPRLRPPVRAGGGQRVGLVHEGVHREEAREAALDDVQRERESEKQETEVHQQHRHRDDGERRILRGQGDDEQLGRPRVGGQGERRSQPPRQAQLDDENAVRQAQRDVARGHGRRDAQAFEDLAAGRASRHGEVLRCAVAWAWVQL